MSDLPRLKPAAEIGESACPFYLRGRLIAHARLDAVLAHDGVSDSAGSVVFDAGYSCRLKLVTKRIAQADKVRQLQPGIDLYLFDVLWSERIPSCLAYGNFV